MYEQNNKDQDSLKKSHSKFSNFKLTLLCLITIISFSAFWIGLALIGFNDINNIFSTSLAIGGGVLTLLGLIGFRAFKR